MNNRTNLHSVELIHAPEWATYLGQKDKETGKPWIDEIPANCIFDKVITGCGATTLAIEQAGNALLAMPYVPLVKNKEQQHRETVIGVYEGVGEAEIMQYINTHSKQKIAVTYDSIPKVASILQRNGIEVYKDFFLIVDEWQVMVNSYEFRYDAIRALLDEAKRFERVTYMSATPIEHRYRLNELKGMSEVKIEWPNRHKIPIETYSVNKPVDCVAQLCIDYEKHKSEEGENWHFFVNSVEFIGKVIRKAELKPEEVRVICSKSRESRRKNQEKLGEEYPIAEPLDPVKRFNFYTSTCFEGCDIYDEDGVTIIVNDGNVPHTLIDVGTLFPQVSGRIRNSKHNRRGIIHIYSTTNSKEELTLTEYESACEKVYADAVSFTKRINKNNDKEDIELLHSKWKYTRSEHGQMMVDPNLLISDILNYQLRNYTYSDYSILQSNLTDAHFDITGSGRYRFETIPYEAVPKISFKEAFKKYCKFVTSDTIWTFAPYEEIANIERTKPLVKEAYDTLGAQEVERLDYNTTKIRREIAKRMNAPIISKLIALIKQSIPYYIHKPDAEIKTILQGIYDELGINRTAKATDLNEWYETKKTSPKIKNQTTACTTIVYEKIVVYRSKK